MTATELESISGSYNKDIYHLLRRALGQCVTISQIIDFDIFNIITILTINFTIDVVGALTARWRGRFW